ncbi:polyprenol reductase-like isoform X1, partial [Dinothrombium tinctorium]
KGKINIVPYILSYAYYFSLGLSIISEAPSLYGKEETTNVNIEVLRFFNWNHIIGLLLFIISSKAQIQSHMILAKLRKNSKGEKYFSK